MFDLLTVVSSIFTVKQLIKESTEPVYPRGTYFDWDEYKADVAKGMSITEQNKKQKRGGYLKTK